MKNGRIGFKLVLSFLIVIAVFAAISVYQILQMQRLQQIEKAVTARQGDYAEIAALQLRTVEVAAVVADAIINRNSEVTQKEWAAVKASSSKDITRMRDFARNDVQRRIADTFGTNFMQFIQYVDASVLPLLTEAESARTTEEIRAINVHQDALRTQLLMPAKAMADSVMAEMLLSARTFDEISRQTVLLAILISVSALAAALLVSLLLSRSITAPLVKGVSFAQTVASGDFTRELAIRRRDEVGTLAESLNSMARKLRETVAAIRGSAELVASSSAEISVSARSLSEAAQSQAATLEQTSASVQELTASVDLVAEHAQSQAAAVSQGSTSMEQVRSSVDEVSRSMKEISDLATASVQSAAEGAQAVAQVVEGIGLIATSSERIGGILSVISEIADQTNLLALNASIEAARAGEHGRGFAVVAAEVSKLADRSSASTKEIEELIRESAKNVASGVDTAKSSQAAMEHIRVSSQKVKEMIARLSSSMDQQLSAITELARALKSVNEMSQGISAATAEQTTNARQVSTAVENVNDLTQQAASAAEEMSASTQQLSQMAQQLQSLMAQFRTSEREEPGKALGQGNAAPAVSALPGKLHPARDVFGK